MIDHRTRRRLHEVLRRELQVRPSSAHPSSAAPPACSRTDTDPPASRIVTSPAGISAVREKHDACDSTGSAAYSVPASAAFTVSACTWLIRSMIGASLYGASTVVIASVDVPITWLTYATTFAVLVRQQLA